MADETNSPPSPVLTPEVRTQLSSVSTATITHQLQRRGIRSCFFSGLRPTRPDLRLLGYAETLRYGPAREDLVQQLGGPANAQRRAVEGISPDGVLVVEARGVPDAGTIGDIYATRVKARGGSGVITDGALRDTPAIRNIDLAVYHQSSHGATYNRHHLPLDHGVPIACAGVLVMPGDVVVGDAEGAVVIPVALVTEVSAAAVRQEAEEEFALTRVQAGEPTTGLFPLSEGRRAEFEAWQTGRGPLR